MVKLESFGANRSLAILMFYPRMWLEVLR